MAGDRININGALRRLNITDESAGDTGSIKLFAPFIRPEESRKATLPAHWNVAAIRDEPIDADAKRHQQPQIDRLRPRDGGDRVPLHLHAVRIEEHHGAAYVVL